LGQKQEAKSFVTTLETAVAGTVTPPDPFLVSILHRRTFLVTNLHPCRYTSDSASTPVTMLQPAVKREKTFAKTTIICIARSSSPQGDDLLHKQKLKKCDDTLHDFVVTILPALEASTYLHVELIVPSNADFSIQGDTVFRQLRDSIITATSAGPVQLVMSSKDGLTINAPGFAKWLKTLPAKIRLANPRLFVSRLDGEPCKSTRQSISKRTSNRTSLIRDQASTLITILLSATRRCHQPWTDLLSRASQHILSRSLSTRTPSF